MPGEQPTKRHDHPPRALSPAELHGWRARLHEVIFEADTPSGRTFDIALILLILFSTILVMLESIPSVRGEYGGIIRIMEWVVTIIFTVEYILRLICVARPMRYASSFYGIIDLLAVIPTYLSVIFPGSQYLISIRALRILRVFRVLKLALYLQEGQMLLRALHASRRKITVFFFGVLTMIFILGSLMYLIEGPEHGFTSIPIAIYWAIVTMTTVGYGDIAPETPLGQMLAALMMLMGYAIIAVPTGILSVEVARSAKDRDPISNQACPACGRNGHDEDASHCKYCGEKL